MDSTQFCYWLQGFIEIGKPKTLTSEQVQEIKNHLNLVFKKVTPQLQPLTLSNPPPNPSIPYLPCEPLTFPDSPNIPYNPWIAAPSIDCIAVDKEPTYCVSSTTKPVKSPLCSNTMEREVLSSEIGLGAINQRITC